MAARLVQLAEGRRVRTLSLARGTLTIGRDPSCDLVLDSARVSRLHARVEVTAEGSVVTDLQSANGTTVRGVPVVEPVVLEPGDEVRVADEVTLVYKTGPPPLIWPAAATLVLVVALLGWWISRPEDAIWTEARALAVEAVAADRQADYTRVRQRLQSAAGLLFREGRLDDVPREEIMDTALARLGEGIEGGVDLGALFSRALEATRPEPVAEPEAVCRLDEVAPEAFDECLRRRVELVMIGLRQDPGAVPEDFYAQIGRRLRHEHLFLEQSLARAPKFRDMMVEELQKANMPSLLHYLACIESGYRVRARSPAGAYGLWQFMPGTAKAYGLRVDEERDERTDPHKSTRAAAHYLRNLAFEFGGEALLLALASYNRGENAVRRALKKLNDPFSQRSYWALVEARHLPRETANYVARYVAAAVAGEAGLPSLEQLEAAGY